MTKTIVGPWRPAYFCTQCHSELSQSVINNNGCVCPSCGHIGETNYVYPIVDHYKGAKRHTYEKLRWGRTKIISTELKNKENTNGEQE